MLPLLPLLLFVLVFLGTIIPAVYLKRSTQTVS